MAYYNPETGETISASDLKKLLHISIPANMEEIAGWFLLHSEGSGIKGNIDLVDGKYVQTYVSAAKESNTLEKAKRQRTENVANIFVTVDGMEFNGDEESQNRMVRIITAYGDGNSVQWVLADNTVATVTIRQLREALRKSVELQKQYWIMPYGE